MVMAVGNFKNIIQKSQLGTVYELQLCECIQNHLGLEFGHGEDICV